MILGFADYEPQGLRLAEALQQPFSLIDIHRFPDGESRIALPSRLPERVVLCRSLDRPNDKLVELLLAAETARELGARHLTLVAPYLCYMRQDVAFHPGEAVSQRIVGRFLGGLFDALITVDPHLHRIRRLSEAVTCPEALALSAAPALGGFLGGLSDPLLLGPDGESEQWVGAVARAAGLEYAVAEKRRHGDREVSIALPARDYRGRHLVLVDDVASTGHTLIEVAARLREAGAASVRCLVTHALFDDSAGRALQEAGVEQLWSSDSIAHPSNAVSLAPLLAEAVSALPRS